VLFKKEEQIQHVPIASASHHRPSTSNQKHQATTIMKTSLSLLARRATWTASRMTAARPSAVTFAKCSFSDAPDGTSDAQRAEDKKQVDQIIDYAASHEDKDAILKEHKEKMQGVDSPDGETDAMRAENQKQVDDIIDYAATHEDKDKILEDHKLKMEGVDAPDGTSDGMRMEDMKEVDEMIDPDKK
jgi:predicted protein tyrosine phosphatase